MDDEEEYDEVYYGGAGLGDYVAAARKAGVTGVARGAVKGLARGAKIAKHAVATKFRDYDETSLYGRPEEIYFAMKNEKNLNNETTVNVAAKLESKEGKEHNAVIKQLINLDNSIAREHRDITKSECLLFMIQSACINKKRAPINDAMTRLIKKIDEIRGAQDITTTPLYTKIMKYDLTKKLFDCKGGERDFRRVLAETKIKANIIKFIINKINDSVFENSEAQAEKMSQYYESYKRHATNNPDLSLNNITLIQKYLNKGFMGSTYTGLSLTYNKQEMKGPGGVAYANSTVDSLDLLSKIKLNSKETLLCDIILFIYGFILKKYVTIIAKQQQIEKSGQDAGVELRINQYALDNLLSSLADLDGILKIIHHTFEDPTAKVFGTDQEILIRLPYLLLKKSRDGEGKNIIDLLFQLLFDANHTDTAVDIYSYELEYIQKEIGRKEKDTKHQHAKRTDIANPEKIITEAEQARANAPPPSIGEEFYNAWVTSLIDFESPVRENRGADASVVTATPPVRAVVQPTDRPVSMTNVGGEQQGTEQRGGMTQEERQALQQEMVLLGKANTVEEAGASLLLPAANGVPSTPEQARAVRTALGLPVDPAAAGAPSRYDGNAAEGEVSAAAIGAGEFINDIESGESDTRETIASPLPASQQPAANSAAAGSAGPQSPTDISSLAESHNLTKAILEYSLENVEAPKDRPASAVQLAAPVVEETAATADAEAATAAEAAEYAAMAAEAAAGQLGGAKKSIKKRAKKRNKTRQQKKSKHKQKENKPFLSIFS